MSATTACPYCGHPHAADRARLGVPMVCERCRQLFTPSEPIFAPDFVPQVAPSGPQSQPYHQPAYSQQQPGNPFAPSHSQGASATTITLLAVGLIGALILMLCGGLGWVALTARSRIIQKANEIEQIQKQRQLELQREAQPPQTVRTETRKRPNPQVAKESPPSTPPRESTTKQNTKKQSTAKQTPSNPHPKSRSKERPRPPRSNATASLDDLLAELNDRSAKRPAWVTLNEIQRLPVQDDRKTEVSAALDQHLRSDDATIATAAAKAAKVWGTEWNLEALKQMLASSHVSVRWEAIRTLPKISQTAETADALAAAATDFSNIGVLREAMKDLGPVGEAALLKQLEKGDRKTKQTVLGILGECGTQASLPKLRQLADGDPDPAVKGMARHALSQIERRNP